MAKTRREQAEWRREKLLDAALDVFADKGVDGASVKDLAQAAGVTPGLLYHYFDSKDALVHALLAERGFLPQLRELLALDTGGRAAAEVLTELLGAFDQLLADNARLVALFFSAGQARTALGELAAEGQLLIGDFLAARVAAGELRPHDTRTAATALFATVAIGRTTGSPVDVAGLVELLYPIEFDLRKK
ncbi:TetR/AcrR family transcriptional regulator [Nonomuraea sp. NEAU-A123]|uniref:TetR/AcrR family transcriptional regulator n=1 Tax=Nonomuraea sp. NEAU-A123 TaxID=2839649 RepID=UPI001BE45BB1|nr:TetR/AcrR family transcriptional regulator [Nonomuraea sp. NEAU-A123]MBT2225334.1 TetR/AcrR family transcriptional regulator [Nonomuraea sp. NEAU-A123]